MHIFFFMTGDTLKRSVLVGSAQMTFFTGRGCMKPNQGKAGQIMVKDYLFLPAGLIVATRTVLTLFTRMDIILLVTGITFHFQFLLKNFALVAGSTNQFFVFSTKREIRFLFVIKRALSPILCAMAALAFLAVFSLVNIIRLVTAITFGTKLLLVQITGVTTIASDTFVFTCQAIVSIFIMIEMNPLPVLLGVTILAFLSVTTIVLVIHAMTAETGLRRFLIILS